MNELRATYVIEEGEEVIFYPERFGYHVIISGEHQLPSNDERGRRGLGGKTEGADERLWLLLHLPGVFTGGPSA